MRGRMDGVHSMKEAVMRKTNSLLSFDTTRSAQRTTKMGGGHRQRQQDDLTSLILFQNVELG
jgi:hypothetical protein